MGRPLPADLVEHGMVRRGQKFHAAAEARLTQLRDGLREIINSLKHTPECERWNNHSHGEHDFVDAPYRCKCVKGKLADLLKGE